MISPICVKSEVDIKTNDNHWYNMFSLKHIYFQFVSSVYDWHFVYIKADSAISNAFFTNNPLTD